MAAVSDKVTAVDGNLGVVCHVCGECLEFKVIISVRSDKFGAWEAATFAPEEEFLDALKRIEGIATVEAETYRVPCTTPTMKIGKFLRGQKALLFRRRHGISKGRYPTDP